MSENKLNIQLTVTDEQMTSLLKGKLETMPDEKIQEIFAGALTEFLKSPTGQQLFYTKDYYSSTPKPSALLEEMVSNAVSKNLLQPEVDALIAVLKNNYPELLKQAIVNVFSGLFFDNIRQANIQSTIYNLSGLLDTKEDKK